MHRTINKKRYLFLLVCVLVSPMILRTPAAHACQCTGDYDVKDDFSWGDIVFEGKVKKTEQDVWAQYTKGTWLREKKGDKKIPFIRVRLEVLRIWKGRRVKYIDVVTGINGALCGFTFEKGKRYVVFAKYSKHYVYKTFEFDKYRFVTTFCQLNSNVGGKRGRSVIGELNRIVIPVVVKVERPKSTRIIEEEVKNPALPGGASEN